MQSSATTVAGYLKSLPAEQGKVIAAVRKVMKSSIPKGYQETMNWGMISYVIPLKTYSATYNGQPLTYAALGAQKNNYAVYLMCVYTDAEKTARLKAAFKKIGKKPNMGKSCIRFKRLEDIPLETIGALVASMPMKAFIAHYEKTRKK